MPAMPSRGQSILASQRAFHSCQVVAVAPGFVILDQHDQFVETAAAGRAGLGQHEVFEFIERRGIGRVVARHDGSSRWDMAPPEFVGIAMNDRGGPAATPSAERMTCGRQVVLPVPGDGGGSAAGATGTCGPPRCASAVSVDVASTTSITAPNGKLSSFPLSRAVRNRSTVMRPRGAIHTSCATAACRSSFRMTKREARIAAMPATAMSHGLDRHHRCTLVQ